ncbi:MAG: hypothetical protein LUI10_06675 [Lachnospiraceae bacterium]|nr:hypothetical protein [Lachnospiraceae bacterium]
MNFMKFGGKLVVNGKAPAIRQLGKPLIFQGKSDFLLVDGLHRGDNF